MLTPPKLLQLSGPFPQHRKLLFQYVTEQIRHRRVPAPVAHLWRITSTNGNLPNPTNRIPGRSTSMATLVADRFFQHPLI